MDDEPKVSVILPIYNQADHIEDVVSAYARSLGSLKEQVEFLLIVNGDRDGSYDCCLKLAESNTNVVAIKNQQPGWGRAVRTGLNRARGEILCYTNSARTSEFVLATHVMAALANPGYVVKANRRLRHPLVRRFGSVLYNVECRYLFDLAVWDVNGTPKVFPRSLLSLLNLEQDGDLIDAEFAAKCRLNDVPVLEIPTVSSVRHGGESTTNYSSALKMYWGAAKLWMQLRDDLSKRDGCNRQ